MDQESEVSSPVDAKKESPTQHQNTTSSDDYAPIVQQQGIVHQHVHQEIHQKTRSVALVSLNISVQDVFGLGKVMEVTLAMFHAHGAFLKRHPFWLQCTLLAWEGLIVLMLVWGLLRVVGLAEVIVWGADDLVRGTLSTIAVIGRRLWNSFHN